MKKLLTVLLALAMIFTLAACGQKTEAGDTPKEEKPVVYFIAPLATGSAWGTANTAFTAKCQELGLDGYYVGPTAGGNVPEMVELTETAFHNGAKVIIGNWRDTEAFNDVVDRALAEGVHIIGSNYTLPGRCETYIGIDPVQLGEAQAEACVENNKDRAELNVFYFTANMSSQSHIINYESFCKKLAELRPDAKVVAYNDTHGDAAEAAEKIGPEMLAHPEINAIVTNCGFAAVTAAAYKEENSLTDEQLYVQGIDGGADILTYVKDGIANCTIIQDWVGVGEVAAQICRDLVDGKEIETGLHGLGAYALHKDGVDAYAKAQGIDL